MSGKIILAELGQRKYIFWVFSFFIGFKSRETGSPNCFSVLRYMSLYRWYVVTAAYRWKKILGNGINKIDDRRDVQRNQFRKQDKGDYKLNDFKWSGAGITFLDGRKYCRNGRNEIGEMYKEIQ